MNNAVKYWNGQPEIKFQVACNDGKVILSVKDNGIGIPEKDISKVFEKGFTGGTRKAVFQVHRHGALSFVKSSTENGCGNRHCLRTFKRY